MILTVFSQVLTTPSVVAGGVSACKITCMVIVIQCEYHLALTLHRVYLMVIPVLAQNLLTSETLHAVSSYCILTSWEQLELS